MQNNIDIIFLEGQMRAVKKFAVEALGQDCTISYYDDLSLLVNTRQDLEDGSNCIGFDNLLDMIEKLGDRRND